MSKKFHVYKGHKFAEYCKKYPNKNFKVVDKAVADKSPNLLDGKSWWLIDDKYYEIPNSKNAFSGWLKNLTTTGKVVTSVLCAGVVAAGVAVPVAVVLTSQVTYDVSLADGVTGVTLSQKTLSNGALEITLSYDTVRKELASVTVTLGNEQLKINTQYTLSGNVITISKETLTNNQSTKIIVNPTLQDKEITVRKIQVKTYPEKTYYNCGEELILTGMEVYATYTDGTKENVTDECTTDPEEGTKLNTPGDQVINVTHTPSGKTCSFSVYVDDVEKTVFIAPDSFIYALSYLNVSASNVSASINQSQNIQFYYYNSNEFDVDADIQIYKDGMLLQETNFIFSYGSPISIIGEIPFEAWEQVNNGDTLELRIKTKIARLIITPPTKTSYFDGEKLDLTGMLVNALYTDGNSFDVTDKCVTNPAEGDELVAGTSVVDVTYTDTSGSSCTDSFDIEVSAKKTATLYYGDFSYELETSAPGVTILEEECTESITQIDASVVTIYYSNTSDTDYTLNIGVYNYMGLLAQKFENFTFTKNTTKGSLTFEVTDWSRIDNESTLKVREEKTLNVNSEKCKSQLEEEHKNFAIISISKTIDKMGYKIHFNYTNNNDPFYAPIIISKEDGTEIYRELIYFDKYEGEYSTGVDLDFISWDQVKSGDTIILSVGEVVTTDYLVFSELDEKTCSVSVIYEKKSLVPENLVIPEKNPSNENQTVTQIGSNGFSYCSNIKTVTLPSTIEYLGDSAFRSCENLTSINLEDTQIIEIFDDTFVSTGLTSISFNKNLTAIGNGAFEYSSLGKIDLQGYESLKTIGNNAFSHCSNLSSISLPNSIVSLGSSIAQETKCTFEIAYGSEVLSTFDDGKALVINTVINSYGAASGVIDFIPSTITEIGFSSLGGSAVTSIVIPENVTKISGWAFHDTPLTSATFEVNKGWKENASGTITDIDVSTPEVAAKSLLAQTGWSYYVE